MLDSSNATAPHDPSAPNGCAYDTEEAYVTVDFCSVDKSCYAAD